MRILVVADEYPWPARTGYRQRLEWVLRILASGNQVDFIAVVLDARAASTSPQPTVQLERIAAVAAGPRREHTTLRMWRWLRGTAPRALLWRDWSAPRELVAAWADTKYDLVWFSHSPCYLALADLITAPHVVDLDNLESMVMYHRRQSMPYSRSRSLGRRLLTRAQARCDAIDEQRWRSVEHDIANRVNAVVVCSRLDQGRLGCENVFVVPNGYELDTECVPRTESRQLSGTPVLLMIGLLTYEANRDAAAFFAKMIMPQVRRDLPHAQFRVVGRYEAEVQVASLRNTPGVAVMGEVADLRGELKAADVVVVPIRFGGGTRIKILEAFANGIPVVSTTVGCEGLDVVIDKHLLVADDPAEFAAACVRLANDPDLHARIATAARQLWASHYRWTSVRPAVVAVVGRATDA